MQGHRSRVVAVQSPAGKLRSPGSPWRGRAALALLLTLAPAAASAQPSDGDRALARTLANEGYDALDRKDYAAAVERFTRADALFHVATVALGLARARVGLGQLVAARETYAAMVREGVPAGAPAPLVKAVADARKELDALAPRIPSLLITVTGPDAAQVTVDGAPVARADLGKKLPVDPGMHDIRATAAGWAAAEASVVIAEKKTESVTLALRREAGAPRPPGATRPLAPSDEAAAAPWPTQKKVGVGLMGAGALGVVIGGALAGVAHGKYADLASKCPTRVACDPSLGPELSSYHAVGAGSVAAFVLGGAALGGGLVVFFTAPRGASPTASRGFVGPRVGVGVGHVDVGGAF